MIMVGVREMGMTVRHRPVLVAMSMPFSSRIIQAMRVSMVLVMHVLVRVLHRFMVMAVLVVFAEVQPDADAHQAGCHQQRDGQRLTE